MGLPIYRGTNLSVKISADHEAIEVINNESNFSITIMKKEGGLFVVNSAQADIKFGEKIKVTDTKELLIDQHK